MFNTLRWNIDFTLHNANKNCVFNRLSGTFRLGSRMFLVCFSFLLRCNLLPVGFIPRIFLVRNILGSEQRLGKIGMLLYQKDCYKRFSG